jgi:uroporphyrinogen-III synthase
VLNLEKSSACKIFYFGPEKPDLPSEYITYLKWVPLVKIVPIENSLDQILDISDKCDSIVFTSPRGVKILKELSIVKERIDEIRNLLRRMLIIPIGGSTNDSLRNEFNVDSCCIPEEWDSFGLGELLCTVKPNCVLLPRARQASRVLIDKLSQCRVDYRVINLYDIEARQNPMEKDIPPRCPLILSSSLIARTFIGLFGCPENNPVIVLGRMTLETLRENCDGISVFMTAKPLLINAIRLALEIGCCNYGKRKIS